MSISSILSKSLFDLSTGDAEGDAERGLQGLAMVCFAEAMREVDPLPEFFADFFEEADDIVADEVRGAVEVKVRQKKGTRIPAEKRSHRYLRYSDDQREKKQRYLRYSDNQRQRKDPKILEVL